MKAWDVLLAFVMGLFLASSVLAQPPDGGPRGRGKGRDGGERGPDFRGVGPGGFPGGPFGDPRGGFRGGPPGGFQGGPQGGFGGGFRGGPPGQLPGGPQGGDPRQQFLQMMLQRYDPNGDGTITPAEVAAFDERMKSRYERMVRDAGMDPTGPIKVSSLQEAMARNMASRGGPQGPGPQQGGPPAGPAGMAQPGAAPRQGPAQPLVPGFGVEAKPVSVATFNPTAGNVPGGLRPGPGAPPGGAPTNPQKPGPSSSSPSRSDSQADSRAKEMADGIMRQYDKNKNKVLDKDEVGQLPGGLRRADRNNDGVITRDELVAQMLEFSRGRGGGGPGREGTPGPGRGGPSSPPVAAGRQSNRLHTAQERPLPPGLPDWFATTDADHDGQITMAEYGAGRQWSDQLAAEFDRWDLNHDGIVTPTECIKVAGQK